MTTRYGYEEVGDNEDFTIEEVSDVEPPAKLRGYTVVIRWRVTSGKHAGCYIGEAYQGMYHPMLIIPASDILKGQS